jgi:hypothetical protein
MRSEGGRCAGGRETNALCCYSLSLSPLAAAHAPSPSTSYAALTAAKRAAAVARTPGLAPGPHRSGCATSAARRNAALMSSVEADRGTPSAAYGSSGRGGGGGRMETSVRVDCAWLGVQWHCRERADGAGRERQDKTRVCEEETPTPTLAPDLETKKWRGGGTAITRTHARPRPPSHITPTEKEHAHTHTHAGRAGEWGAIEERGGKGVRRSRSVSAPTHTLSLPSQPAPLSPLSQYSSSPSSAPASTDSAPTSS